MYSVTSATSVGPGEDAPPLRSAESGSRLLPNGQYHDLASTHGVLRSVFGCQQAWNFDQDFDRNGAEGDHELTGISR